MSPHAILSLPRRALNKCGRMVAPMTTIGGLRRSKLLFVFGGRTQHWAGMGSQLYETESVFRSCIREADKIIRELGWSGILPNFENPGDDTFFSDEPNVIFTITSLQMALTDLWRSKGILPNAIMGVSLGEVAAVYAAGGLSMRDALKIAASISLISRIESQEFVVLQAPTSLARAKALSKQSPVLLVPIYEITDESTLFFCHLSERDSAREFLSVHHIRSDKLLGDPSWPYHTPLILKHRAALVHDTREVEPRPLRCDYFSSNYGRLVRSGEIIDNEYWFDLKHWPVLTHSALKAATDAGYQMLLHLGAHPFLKGQFLASALTRHRGVQLLDSMAKGFPEAKLFDSTRRTILRTRLAPSVLRSGDGGLDHFRRNFSLEDPRVIQNGYAYVRYLQRHGSVHFLPRCGGWIVLDYEDVNHVLKSPEKFSSLPQQGFDPTMLGADAPSHRLMRSALAPLFSPQRLSEVAEYAAARAQLLLDGLISRRHFDGIEDFSLPLTQVIAAKFLDLGSIEQEELADIVRGHIYDLSCLDQLEKFCAEYLERHQEGGVGQVASLLLALVSQAGLPFKGAVSLMRLLWIAGTTTTSMLIGTALYILSRDHQLAQKLRGDESLINKFIEECLRLEAPESELRRITTAPVLLGGHEIPAGSTIIVSLRAANRDPKYFERPDEFSLECPSRRHLSFGGGPHVCPGMNMARSIANQVIKGVVERLPGLKLDTDCPVKYFPSSHFRALSQLPLCID